MTGSVEIMLPLPPTPSLKVRGSAMLRLGDLRRCIPGGSIAVGRWATRDGGRG